jgi:hypothetical protein
VVELINQVCKKMSPRSMVKQGDIFYAKDKSLVIFDNERQIDIGLGWQDTDMHNYRQRGN